MPIIASAKSSTFSSASAWSLATGVELRAIDRWQELENGTGHALPKTYLQALEALVESEKQKAAALAIAEEKRIQLDESKQWYTIKRVAFANGLNWKELEWRKLKNAGDKPCKKVFDANFPLGVNAYHQSAWEEVYPELDLPDNDYSKDTALVLGVVR